jgi:hypothetical protein
MYRTLPASLFMEITDIKINRLKNARQPDCDWLWTA